MQEKNMTNIDTGFLPALLKVEVSADQIMTEEVLWVTTWWQNIGSCPSERPLKGFMELHFGHQRIIETKPKYYRTYWEPYPQTQCWKQGDIWKTTCRWNASAEWNGTFKLHIGLCDEQHVPVKVIGAGGEEGYSIHIGEVDIGWGWGLPTSEAARKPWSKEFNLPAQAAVKKESLSSPISIGDTVKVELDNNKPILYGIKDTKSHFVFDTGNVEVVLRQRCNDSLLYSYDKQVTVDFCCIENNGSNVAYTCEVLHDKNFTAGFSLSFYIKDRELEITAENIKEAAGYELLEIRIPELISDARKDTHIIEFYGGGRLIPLDKTLPIRYIHPYDMRNAAAIFNADGMLALESYCLDDIMYVAVKENDHEKRGSIGISIVNRVRAKGKMESIKVDSTHRITIDLLDEKWGKPSWQAFAKFMRKDLKGKASDIYKRSLFYKHEVTSGPQPPEGRVREDDPFPLKRLTSHKTFDECLENIRKYYNILDGMTQVAYIGGFQKGGFDSGYPYVLETDPRCGTVEDLRNCIEEGKKYNAIVGFHDNYDTNVAGEHFDPGMISIDEEGNLWRGWIWAGGMEYITSPYKYAKTGAMQERVKKTVETYGLHTSNHLDVLSSEILRYDFDPECPASATKSIEGKYAIVEEFNKYGIDITSENLLHPFVGYIGHALWPAHDNKKAVLFPGERFIPLLNMTYHGFIGYCGGGGLKGELMWSLVGGNRCCPGDDPAESGNIKGIYLINMPIDLLYERVMQDVIEKGSTIKVVYDDSSYVYADFNREVYEVVVDGQLVAKNFSTFVPGFKENSWLAYAAQSGMLSYPAPKGWTDDTLLKAVKLTLEGEGEELVCTVKDGKFEMEIPAEVPVRIMVVN